MRWQYIGLGTLLLLTGVFMSVGHAAQTDNLLPNTNSGVDWNSSSTDMINSGGSGVVYNGNNINGFTVTCPAQQANCGYKYDVGGDFEVTGTATISADNIKLYSDTITQTMLDNGITLESNIDVANCESNQGNCESKGGANDSHSISITLKDNANNVLSTVTQTRTEISGFQGNCNGYPGTNSTGVTADCGQYTDTLIFTDVGANNLDWSWTATDNNYTNQSQQGPNLLGASLVMTYEEFIFDNATFDEMANDLFDIEQNLDFDVDEWIDDFSEFYIDDDFDNFELIYDEPIDTSYDDMPFMEFAPEFLFEDTDTTPLMYEFESIEAMPFFEDEEEAPIFLGEGDDVIEEGNEEEFEETEFVEETTEEIQEMPSEDLATENFSLTEALQEPKESIEVVTDSINPSLDLVVQEVVVKDIDKYLLQTAKTLQGILKDQPLLIDREFYEVKDVYLDQPIILDNADFFVQQTAFIVDPMEEHKKAVNINLEKQLQLKKEIERLKWN